MNLIYNDHGYKVYSVDILGYPCKVHQTTQSGCLVGVPTGNNKQEKEMFDSLVYFHKSEYWGKTKVEAIRKVRKFIADYQL